MESCCWDDGMLVRERNEKSLWEEQHQPSGQLYRQVSGRGFGHHSREQAANSGKRRAGRYAGSRLPFFPSPK